jgi:hypothetical protein
MAVTNYLQQFRATISILGQAEAGDLDPGLRNRLLDAFREWR